MTAPMRVLSVCSGIEAAAVAWPWWTFVASSDIDPFANAVRAHHYPDVPNLGDMTKFKEWPDFDVDLVCGGTPCQAFSIAGLRQGLADPRGNLTLTFLAIVDRYKPRWVVFENVPGIISDQGEAFLQFLDGLEAIGYVVDVDILDAQFHGLAQRRRRVFVCAERAENILKRKTISSALTLAQCLAESLLLTSAALTDRLRPDWAALGFDGTQPVHSLQRRMNLFGLHRAETASMLLANLGALRQWSEQEHAGWGCQSGKSGPAGSRTSEGTRSPRSKGSTVAGPGDCPNTDSSWNATLVAALATMNECITSTAGSATTESKIYTCAAACLCIAERITPSMRSSPTFWSAASSTLIALKEFTAYARQASSDLFTDVEWLQPWRDFIGEAERAAKSLGDIGVECFGEVLPISQSGSRDTPPRREAGEGSPGLVTPGVDGSGEPLAFGGGNTSGVTIDPGFGVCGTLSDGAHMGGGLNGQDAYTGRILPVAFHPTQDPIWSDDGSTHAMGCGSKGGQASVAVAFSCKDHGADASAEVAPTMRAMGHSTSHANAGGQLAVSIALRASQGGGDKAHVFTGYAVRRLTPAECEALMGFPRGYTAIPYRGKPAADGPRYKALGNSWAVNVARWVGQRIQMVDDIAAELNLEAAE